MAISPEALQDLLRQKKACEKEYALSIPKSKERVAVNRAYNHLCAQVEAARHAMACAS